MLHYIQNKYKIHTDILKTQNKQYMKVSFPFFKITILSKKKISVDSTFGKESNKYTGVGNTLVNWFTAYLGCLQQSINGTINRKSILRVNNFITYDTHFLTEKKLYWFKKEQKKIWWSLFSYHNARRKKGLPVRGQRTKTNASTAKKLKIK